MSESQYVMKGYRRQILKKLLSDFLCRNDDQRQNACGMVQTMITEEIEKLIELHGTSIYSFCCHLTGSRFLADDLYQDTLLKVCERKHRIRGGRCAEELLLARNYAIGIAIRLWKHQNRRNRRQNFSISLEDGMEENSMLFSDPFDMETELEEKEMIQHLRLVIGRLTEKLRVVVTMYYTMEMSVEDIAGRLHIPKGTVKSRMYKARKKIAEEMEAAGYEISL